jgi:hypothetical protein
MHEENEGCPATVGFYGGDTPPEPCGAPVNPTSTYGYCTRHTELERMAEQTLGGVTLPEI